MTDVRFLPTIAPDRLRVACVLTAKAKVAEGSGVGSRGREHRPAFRPDAL